MFVCISAPCHLASLLSLPPHLPRLPASLPFPCLHGRCALLACMTVLPDRLPVLMLTCMLARPPALPTILPTLAALSAHLPFRLLCQPAHPATFLAVTYLSAHSPAWSSWSAVLTLRAMTCLSSVSIIQISSKADPTSCSVDIQVTCLCHESNDILLINCSF